MVGNSTSTTKKYGGQKYYVCGGYMRKGKEFCPYVSWRKDRIEQIVVNKLRSALLRLTFDNQLEEEIRKYHDEANRHQIVSAANMEAEINFLEKRIEQMQQELRTGSGKAYYMDMISEMSSELTEKRREHADQQSASQAFSVSQESLQTLQQDIKTMIGLLDEETPSPQLMNEWVKRFVSNVTVYRETEELYLSLRLISIGQVIYEKMIVTSYKNI
ncbi:zinc ribbon domain-containing protein [Paenibacillus borealis]|uniref:zinc ribbon domain-containing protein n=1 Tax=Paenibacillus borealis TaxID=160799 RepID=UPI001FDECC13